MNRKVKIEGKWVMAVAPLDKSSDEVCHLQGQRVAVDGGTFYIASGRGKTREHRACGEDPDGVRRALATQAHVLELRRLGMEVKDAPEIVENSRKPANSLCAIATRTGKGRELLQRVGGLTAGSRAMRALVLQAKGTTTQPNSTGD